jgi:hypothetical protein
MYLDLTSILAIQPSHYMQHIPMHRIRAKYGILNMVKSAVPREI